MKRWSWLLALIPLGLGLLAAIYLWFIAKTNPIAFLRIDLGSLAFVLGLGLLVLVGSHFLLYPVGLGAAPSGCAGTGRR